jgi:predicted TIM-barrel fold metal-dependent hydrolase
MRSRRLAALLVLAALAAGASVASAQRPGVGAPTAPNVGAPGRGAPLATSPVPWVDVHIHLIADRQTMDYRGAVAAAVAAMNDAGITRAVVMPPPQPSGSSAFDYDGFAPALVPRDRFAFLGGGGSLNGMIQDAKPDAVDDRLRQRFEARATQIVKDGAVGFGEITAHHLSHAPGHPYESSDADHPLLRLLADIAARHDVVIDFHFDVASEETKAPDWMTVPPNPAVFQPNLAAFERLLEHNRKARIVWAHAGSDMFGHWTPELSRRLLAKHPNLFMSLRMVPGRAPQNHPLDREGTLRPEWLALFQEFPDRFVIGADQFFVSPTVRGGHAADQFAQRAPIARQRTATLLAALPPDLARRIASENALRIYKLGG